MQQYTMIYVASPQCVELFRAVDHLKLVFGNCPISSPEKLLSLKVFYPLSAGLC